MVKKKSRAPRTEGPRAPRAKQGRPSLGLVTVACRVTKETFTALVKQADARGITVGGCAGVLLSRSLGIKGIKPRPAKGKYAFKARPRNKKQLSLLKEGA